jgi:cyclase
MKIRALSTVFAAALVLAAPASAQSKLKPVKVVDGVWAAQPDKGANVGWFLLGDGVVAVDAGADAANGAEILKAIAETTGGKPVRTLILTHAHADHSGGAGARAAAGAFVSQATSDPNDPMYGKSSLRPVVESISERAISVDGLHNVQVYFLGAAHTKGDLVVYLANDKVLFSGDIALNGRMPFLQSPDVDPAGWEKALLTLSKVPAEKLVPGHGDIGSKEGIADSLAYIHAVNQLARRFVDNAMRDDMMDAQIRAPENEIKNIPVTDAHIANVKAAVRAMREKAAVKPTPTPAAK